MQGWPCVTWRSLRRDYRQGLLGKAIKHEGDQREEDDAEILVPCKAQSYQVRMQQVRPLNS